GRASPALRLRLRPALDTEPRGVPALRKVGRLLSGDPKSSLLRGLNQDVGLQRSSRIARTGGPMGGRLAPPLLTGRGPAWLDTIAPDGVRRLVFVGNAGGG